MGHAFCLFSQLIFLGFLGGEVVGELERRGDGRLFYWAVIFNVTAPGAAVVAVVSCATFAGRIVFGYKQKKKLYIYYLKPKRKQFSFTHRQQHPSPAWSEETRPQIGPARPVCRSCGHITDSLLLDCRDHRLCCLLQRSLLGGAVHKSATFCTLQIDLLKNCRP